MTSKKTPHSDLLKKLSSRQAAIDILREQLPDNKIDLRTLNNELCRRRALGFRVETRDVVYTLEQEKLVGFDRETETVFLLPIDTKCWSGNLL